MELSSEVPGTNADWPSDITLWVNDVLVGTWTSPGDYGDKRGVYTPRWWKLEGSQYGKLKTWRITDAGSFVDGVRLSDVTLATSTCRAITRSACGSASTRTREHPGGVNIFGSGFGNYDQDIVMRSISSATGEPHPGSLTRDYIRKSDTYQNSALTYRQVAG